MANRSGVHSPAADRIAGIVGIDVTQHYMSLILAKWVPECSDSLRIIEPETADSFESAQSADTWLPRRQTSRQASISDLDQVQLSDSGTLRSATTMATESTVNSMRKLEQAQSEGPSGDDSALAKAPILAYPTTKGLRSAESESTRSLHGLDSAGKLQLELTLKRMTGRTRLTPEPLNDAFHSTQTFSSSVMEGREPPFHSFSATDATSSASSVRKRRSPSSRTGGQARCLLMQDQGYLVAHPDLVDARWPVNRPIEANHIMEPLVGKDILSHTHHIRKVACVDFVRRITQRFYIFNVSNEELIKNSALREQCVRYQLKAVPGSTAFFGIIHEARRPDCSPFTAFCSCSTWNRSCLNCGQPLEPLECECPCECPVGLGLGLLSSHKEDESIFASRPSDHTEAMIKVSPTLIDIGAYDSSPSLPAIPILRSSSLQGFADPPICLHALVSWCNILQNFIICMN
ncbi:unnamed protein product [Protopolystoma xenopodis]|uniref:Uncharacterized protein n=1 Tax=Protopolystoma xenopodis TaxID=117903 RepID=A0A448WBB1_9PLAT|nr:unnamed protein product [Protopolystoma xenopodis]